MTQLEYPLVGYESQAAAQQRIFERYKAQIHLCIIDPDKFRIDSEERMQALVDDYAPLFTEMNFEQNIEDSGIDPNAIHVEVADPNGNEVTYAREALRKLTRGLHLDLGFYPARNRPMSSGKLVIKDSPRTHRIAFEFSHSLKDERPATLNPTDFVIQNFQACIDEITGTESSKMTK